MPNIHAILGLLAGIVSLFAFIPYTYSIIRGETKPERATWFIWSLVGLIILVSYYSSGARDTIWVPLGYVVAQIFIAILSIKYGVGGWSTLDKICGLGVIISIILWILLESPLVALVIGIVIDFFGVIPTVSKTYKNPKTENKLAWGLGFSASVINLLALESLSAPVVSYPLYMFFNTGLIFVLTFRHKRKFISV